ncbi:hypothetical protein ABPG77_009653 [Micractinium sp. CCAP 211/92]
MSNLGEVEAVDDLFSEFGSPQKTAAHSLPAPNSAAVAPAATAAATGLGGPEPPLVTVPPGAADLYADLFGSGDDGAGTLLKTQVAELSERAQRQEAQIQALQAQVEALTQQNGALSERAATLAANISSLYNTAKLELARKDAQIRELRENPTAPGSTTPAEMVQTRRAAAIERADEGLDRVLSNLQASCSSTPAAPPVSSKFAAVLVPLFEDPVTREVHVVLNQRSSRLNTHSGEVCCPGGKRDEGDADDIATALREAEEELGIDPAAVTVVGCLPPFLSKHLLSVTPVLGVIPPHLKFRPNPTEVAAVFTVPLRRFLEAGPGYSFRDVEWQHGLPYRLHYFEYEHRGRSFCIWGLTAGMLIVAAEKAFGRRPAFQPNPPNALPYTCLAVGPGGQLVFRPAGPGSPRGAAEPDALGLAAEAAAEESPRSAAIQGAVVTQQEAAAALGSTEHHGGGTNEHM